MRMPSSFLCLPLFSVILNKHYLRDNNVPCAKGNLSPQAVDSLRTKQTSDVITMTQTSPLTTLEMCMRPKGTSVTPFNGRLSSSQYYARKINNTVSLQTLNRRNVLFKSESSNQTSVRDPPGRPVALQQIMSTALSKQEFASASFQWVNAQGKHEVSSQSMLS